MRQAKAGFAALLLAFGFVTQGCYLSHLASGQWRLLRARQPIADVLADPDTPEALREQLELVLRTRAYASQLGLEVGEQYTSYVPWEGDRIITSVVAALPGTLEPATFWFPIVGYVPYRGYFDVERAEAEAARLRADGYDVCLGPVRAYSTLGWFDDPVTGPMLGVGDSRLVEALLHELVHATAFAASQPDFNEGIATFVGEEASVGFFAQSRTPEGGAEQRLAIEERRAINAEMLALRDGVAALYESEPAGPERRAQRLELEADARLRLTQLPLQVYDAAVVGEQVHLNDACLAIAATYTADLPAFSSALERSSGLKQFIGALREAAQSDDPREALLGE